MAVLLGQRPAPPEQVEVGLDRRVGRRDVPVVDGCVPGQQRGADEERNDQRREDRPEQVRHATRPRDPRGDEAPQDAHHHHDRQEVGQPVATQDPPCVVDRPGERQAHHDQQEQRTANPRRGHPGSRNHDRAGAGSRASGPRRNGDADGPPRRAGFGPLTGSGPRKACCRLAGSTCEVVLGEGVAQRADVLWIVRGTRLRGCRSGRRSLGRPG